MIEIAVPPKDWIRPFSIDKEKYLFANISAYAAIVNDPKLPNPSLLIDANPSTKTHTKGIRKKIAKRVNNIYESELFIVAFSIFNFDHLQV